MTDVIYSTNVLYWYLLAIAGLAVMVMRHIATKERRKHEKRADNALKGIK